MKIKNQMGYIINNDFDDSFDCDYYYDYCLLFYYFF
jgi:hypothetical protein